MCLILIAINRHPEYPLILAANRDEFFKRPTLSAHFWDEKPDVLAGKDQLAGGTWLGIRKDGKVACVTNYRDPREMKTNALSRGSLTKDFLISEIKTLDYIQSLQANSSLYNGFNLLLSDNGSHFYHYSNISGKITEIQEGLVGLSNHLLDTPWPKVAIGKKKLQDVIDNESIDPEQLFKLLSDNRPAKENQLPSTGIATELEKQLSPIFIKMKGYGTRCSTALLINKERQVSFSEITFDENEEITQKHFYSFSLIK